MASTLVLLSGGLDSATVAYLAAQEEDHDGVAAVHFQYGQRNYVQESNAAQNVAFNLRMELYNVRLTGVWSPQYAPSHVLQGGPKGPSRNVEDNIVYGRNAVLISCAHSLAQQLGYDRLGFGAKQSEFPDCQPEYLSSLGAVLGPPDLWLPLIDMSREEAVRLARTLNVPIEKTWSCYEGVGIPCGRCGACLNRAEAGV